MATLEGRLVAKWRKHSVISQEELGARVGLSRGRIKNVETLASSISVANLTKIIRGLDVPGQDDESRLARFFQGPERDPVADAYARLAEHLEAQAAQAQAELVNKGARPEEVASMQARVRAAQATVDLLAKQVERERGLHERGVTPVVRLEELEGQLSRATAERESLESALRDLSRGARKEEKQAKTLLSAIAESMPQFPLDGRFEQSLPAELRPFFESWRAGRHQT